MNKLTEMQQAQLNILHELDKLCKDNHIQYFIIGGSAIGCIRHQGFIPWDDDIDVGILRPDYDRFVDLAHDHWKGRIQIRNYKFDQDFNQCLTHAIDTSIHILDEERICPVKTYVWIDVNPLDGFPANGIRQKLHYFRLRYIKNLIVLSDFERLFDLNKQRSKPERIIISFIKKINPFKHMNTKELITKLERVLKKYNVNESPCIGNFVGRYKQKEIMPRKIFEGISEMQFEDSVVPVMQGYDNYLRQLYGDYLTLPPMEERINRHAMKVINNNKSIGYE